MEYYENQVFDPNYCLPASSNVDDWLQSNTDWPMYDPSMTGESMYIQPNTLDMYSPSLLNTDRRVSDASSPPTPSLYYEDDLSSSIDPAFPISPTAESAYTPPSPAAAPPKKRGRPRIVRPENSSTESTTKSSTRPSKRLPHNQVERKYREGLNAELERLRLALPTLPKWDVEHGSSSMSKASKATVLATAVAYIRDIERELDSLKQENEALKDGGRGRARREYD